MGSGRLFSPKSSGSLAHLDDGVEETSKLIQSISQSSIKIDDAAAEKELREASLAAPVP